MVSVVVVEVEVEDTQIKPSRGSPMPRPSPPTSTLEDLPETTRLAVADSSCLVWQLCIYSVFIH